MKALWPLLALATCNPCFSQSSPEAGEDEQGRFYGMLRERDLTPFGFLRLDMRPAHAVSIEPGSFAFEVAVGYQNTWALSENVEKYLTALESQGRRAITPEIAEEIRALPGEDYLLDLESATIDFMVHYKISSQWTVYGIASAVRYDGGFLDSSIESFHKTFGFSTFGRPAIKRNQASVILDLKGEQFALIGESKEQGFMDPVLGLRYIGIKLPGPWQMSVEAAAKIPLEGQRMLLSTGRSDYGLQMSVRRLGEVNALHLDLSAVYYAGQSTPAVHESQIVPTLIIGWERQLTARTNVNLQGYVSPSLYTREQTDLEELLSEKYQLSIGLRHRFDCCLLSFGITENLQNFSNTPDVGMQMGFAWVPKIKPQ
jgi:hypothetical protein